MLSDLISLAASGESRGGQIRLACPLCGKKALDLALGESSLLANCYSDGCRDQRGRIMSALGLPTRPLTLEEVAFLKGEVFTPREDLPPAGPPSVLHAAYAAVLAQCPLTPEGLASLARRGFTPEDAARLGYGSWRGVLDVRKLPATGGVPGLGGGQYALSDPRYSGVLVPCRGLDGRIFALKVRLDRSDAGGKMRTFSSAAWGGPRGLYGVHHPLGSPRRASKVWVVEGELKADFTFARLGQSVIGIPGVHGV